MNGAFRSAFWALCLSFGVPLAMFVGAEMFATPPRAPQAVAKRRASAPTDRANTPLATQQRGYSAPVLSFEADPAGQIPAQSEPVLYPQKRLAATATPVSRIKPRRDPPQPEPATGDRHSAGQVTSTAEDTEANAATPSREMAPLDSARTASVPGAASFENPARAVRDPASTAAPSTASPPTTSVAPEAGTLTAQPPAAGGQVQLDPRLEADDGQAPPQVAARSMPKAGAPSSVRLQGIEEPTATEPPSYNHSLQARLVRLQQHVDQLAQVQQQQQFDQLQQATQLLQQLQQNNQLEEVERQLQNLRATQKKNLPQGSNGAQAAQDPSGAANGGLGSQRGQGTAPLTGPDTTKTKRKRGGVRDPDADANADDTQTAEPDEGDPTDGEVPPGKNRSRKQDPDDKSDPAPASKTSDVAPVMKATPAEDGSENFSLQIKDAEISEVLDMIGQLSGRNILATPKVTGKVSVNLHQVNLEQGLKAILKAGGFVFEEDADFIYVSTAEEAEDKAALNRKVLVKVYRPNYISVKEVKALVTPILTPRIGKLSVTDPSEVGIASGSTAAGGDSLSQRDAILIQDYAEVLQEIDRVILEMDVPAMQVVIEAKILSVSLTDSLQYGINFALINKSANNNLVVSGNGATLFGTSGAPGGDGATIVPPVGQFLADTAGLKYGFIQGSVSGFLSALENIADTNLIASPQLMVLNKQRAELIIGRRLPYKTLAFNGTQTAENVNFLDAGTKLRIRPFIAPDGLVRMEIHPERSTATQDATTNLPVLSTTEVTSNVMVRDGNTLVIGGLIEEQVVESYARIPFLGALPVVGAAFRNKNESIVRTELIILITPRIVNQDAAADQGAVTQHDNEERADHFRNNTNRLNRRNLARLQYDHAMYHFERGNLMRAREFAKRALFYSKNDMQALQLRDRIEQTIKSKTLPWTAPPETPPESFLNPPEPEPAQQEPVSLPGVGAGPAANTSPPANTVTSGDTKN